MNVTIDKGETSSPLTGKSFADLTRSTSEAGDV